MISLSSYYYLAESYKMTENKEQRSLGHVLRISTFSSILIITVSKIEFSVNGF